MQRFKGEINLRLCHCLVIVMTKNGALKISAPQFGLALHLIAIKAMKWEELIHRFEVKFATFFDA